jgi:hypothetical protein
MPPLGGQSARPINLWGAGAVPVAVEILMQLARGDIGQVTDI